MKPAVALRQNGQPVKGRSSQEHGPGSGGLDEPRSYVRGGHLTESGAFGTPNIGLSTSTRADASKHGREPTKENNNGNSNHNNQTMEKSSAENDGHRTDNSDESDGQSDDNQPYITLGLPHTTTSTGVNLPMSRAELRELRRLQKRFAALQKVKQMYNTQEPTTDPAPPTVLEVLNTITDELHWPTGRNYISHEDRAVEFTSQWRMIVGRHVMDGTGHMREAILRAIAKVQPSRLRASIQ